MTLSKNCKFLWNRWCIALPNRREYYCLSCFLCTSVTEKPSVCMAPFLTTSTSLHKRTSEVQSAQPFFIFPATSFPVAPCFKMSQSVLKCNPMWPGCSTSQWCATKLAELSFQRPHLIWSLMPSNFLTLINQQKASLALLTPFATYSSKTGHHSGVCLYSNRLWPFWLCFACCDYLFFVLV